MQTHNKINNKCYTKEEVNDVDRDEPQIQNKKKISLKIEYDEE